MRTWHVVRPVVVMLALLTPGGCVGPFGPPDERTIRYDGAVTRRDGSPVAGVRLEIITGPEVLRSGTPPPPDGSAPCSGTVDGAVDRATTDARGRYLVQARRRPPVGGPCVRVRATPPVASGLAEAVVTGLGNQYTQPDSDEDLLHRRVDVVLQPAQ